MALTLNVDGEFKDSPSDTDIAYAFESLDKGTGLFTGPGISIIVLQRDEANSLTATGTRDAGFLLSYQDGDPQYEFNPNPNHAITLDETVRTFQAYAHGQDWGQSKFKWERLQLYDKTPNILKRLAIIGGAAFLIYVALKYLTR